MEALFRRPETAADAYRAMIEENEIRVGLSYWERARIAASAGELGVFGSPREAVRGLFGTASRAKQSKIASFLTLHDALGDVVAHPAAIPERLGLALVCAIRADEGIIPRLRAAAGAPDAATEQAALSRALAGGPERRAAPAACTAPAVTPRPLRATAA